MSLHADNWKYCQLNMLRCHIFKSLFNIQRENFLLSVSSEQHSAKHSFLFYTRSFASCWWIHAWLQLDSMFPERIYRMKHSVNHGLKVPKKIRSYIFPHGEILDLATMILVRCFFPDDKASQTFHISETETIDMEEK